MSHHCPNCNQKSHVRKTVKETENLKTIYCACSNHECLSYFKVIQSSEIIKRRIDRADENLIIAFKSVINKMTPECKKDFLKQLC